VTDDFSGEAVVYLFLTMELRNGLCCEKGSFLTGGYSFFPVTNHCHMLLPLWLDFHFNQFVISSSMVGIPTRGDIMGAKIDPLNLEIGLRIKEIREEKGLSRRELAGKAEVTEQTVLYVETGKRGLSSYTIRGFSRALNVTSDRILFGQTDTKDQLDYLSQALVSLTDQEQRSARIVVDTLAEVLRGYDKPQYVPD